MGFKRFVAATTKDAMTQVRRTLGDDAVILSNRRVGNGQIEILAAASAAVEAIVEDARRPVRGAAQSVEIAPGVKRVGPAVESFQDYLRRQPPAPAARRGAPATVGGASMYGAVAAARNDEDEFTGDRDSGFDDSGWANSRFDPSVMAGTRAPQPIDTRDARTGAGPRSSRGVPPAPSLDTWLPNAARQAQAVHPPRATVSTRRFEPQAPAPKPAVAVTPPEPAVFRRRPSRESAPMTLQAGPVAATRTMHPAGAHAHVPMPAPQSTASAVAGEWPLRSAMAPAPDARPASAAAPMMAQATPQPLMARPAPIDTSMPARPLAAEPMHVPASPAMAEAAMSMHVPHTPEDAARALPPLAEVIAIAPAMAAVTAPANLPAAAHPIAPSVASVAAPTAPSSTAERPAVATAPDLRAPVSPQAAPSAATASIVDSPALASPKPVPAGVHTSGMPATEIRLPAPAPESVNSQLMAELASLRASLQQQLSSLSHTVVATDAMRRNPIQTRVMTRFLTSGFSVDVARRIALNAPELPGAEAADVWMQDVLAHNLRCGGAEDSIVERGGVFALVGPTGVGKTTTVAKLAARFAVKHGAAALGLITLDGYRVAAQEQLRTYGRILGAPVHLAQDGATLRELLASMKGKRLVLIDTCGLGPRDERLGEMLGVLAQAGQGPQRVQPVMLLNAASHAETLDEIARAWRAQDAAGAILTKLDEAARIGGALDCALRYKLRLLGLTNGQRVPEDLHLPNARLLAHLALKPSNQLFALAEDEGVALAQQAAMAGIAAHA